MNKKTIVNEIDKAIKDIQNTEVNQAGIIGTMHEQRNQGIIIGLNIAKQIVVQEKYE